MKEDKVITATDEVKRFAAWMRRGWAASMGVVFALVIGIVAGVVWARGEIIDDCKYAGSFRVQTQAFTCVRKI